MSSDVALEGGGRGNGKGDHECYPFIVRRSLCCAVFLSITTIPRMGWLGALAWRRPGRTWLDRVVDRAKRA